jgi:hypothetical protein
MIVPCNSVESDTVLHKPSTVGIPVLYYLASLGMYTVWVTKHSADEGDFLKWMVSHRDIVFPRVTFMGMMNGQNRRNTK